MADDPRKHTKSLLKVADRIAKKWGLKTAAFDEAVVRKAFEAAGEQCECTRKTCDVRHEGRCPRMLKWADRGPADDEDAWQAHHWIAQSKSGSDDVGNCEILCVPCHKSTESYGRSPGTKG